MSLSGALGIAQSALANTAAQTALLSQNIANVGNADYSRKSATTVTQVNGAVLTGPTRRATDNALLASLLTAQSASSSQQALSDGLTRIAATLGLDASSSASEATDTSPATAVGALATALQQYDADPSDDSLATAAVSAARALVSNLNAAAASVQAVRQQADGDIAASVGTINGLLAQFQGVNATIVAGTGSGKDVSDAQDARDGLLKQLSQQVGITTVQDPNGGTSIYTDSGATLFQNGTARTVSFTATNPITAGATGNPVTVDGLPITGKSVLPIASGALAGLTALRDTAAVNYGDQLDQIASGLIATFADSGTSGTSKTLPGLFVASGTSGLPTSTTGLAATIAVNAAVDPTRQAAPPRCCATASTRRIPTTTTIRRRCRLLDLPRRAGRRAGQGPHVRVRLGRRRLGHAGGLRRLLRELARSAAADGVERRHLPGRGGGHRDHGAVQRHRRQPRRPAFRHPRRRARLSGLGAAPEHGQRDVFVAAPGVQLSFCNSFACIRSWRSTSVQSR